MRGTLITLVACGLLAAVAPARADDLAALRGEVARAIEIDGDAATRDALATRLFAYARTAAPRSRFWSAMSLVATLCDAGPRDRARVWRATALAMLAGRFDDANRWSALLTTRFMPDLSQTPRADWDDEVASYDAVLVDLAGQAAGERVACELRVARSMFAVHINRATDWMPDDRRRQAIRDLEAIRVRYGELPCPGSGDDATRTVGARATRLADELATLHFGAIAPAITGVDLDGQPFDLAQLRGRVVVLDFWTSFCQPCLALVPHARVLLESLDGEPVAFIGVNGDTDRALGRRVSAKTGMIWPSAWDGPEGSRGPAALAYHVPAMGWPSVFVLDARGRIRAKLYGSEQVERHLDRTVRTLLAELEDAAVE